jgi:hypothetical protein
MIGRRLRRLVCVLSLAALGALACSQRRPAADEPWVADAARRHALADERLEANDWRGAQDALRGIVATPGPADLPADDRRGVLQDTYFRLARIELDAHDPVGALRDADRGLALGRPADLFVANLLVVRGAIHEALNNAPLAAVDYHQALLINDELLAKALHEPADARMRGDAP